VRSTLLRIAVLALQKEGKNTSSDKDRQMLGHIMNASIAIVGERKEGGGTKNKGRGK